MEIYELIHPFPPYKCDSFTEFFEYTMEISYRNSRKIAQIIGSIGVLYAIKRAFTPKKRYLYASMGIDKDTSILSLRNSLRVIAPSRYDFLMKMAIDKVINGSNDLALSKDEEDMFQYLCEEGVRLRTSYNQAKTQKEKNELFQDTYKKFVITMVLSKYSE